MLIVGLTLVGAIVIVTVFSLLATSQESAPATDYIEQLKRPTPGEKPAGQGQSAAPETITYQGKLSEIVGNKITIIEKAGGQNRYFILNANTSVSYGGKTLKQADLHVGDELDITAEQQADNSWLAKSIIVTLSTSPTVPTQVNVAPTTPGVVLPPSKRTIL